ncbi:MAG TPA: UPF0182 family protein [Patescibacteria group bacterium]|nr:UPF0182 family protein [Patescibacteria group bacterium]
MADLFDEFMKELRRRQAEASGRPVPDADAADASADPDPDPDPDAPADDVDPDDADRETDGPSAKAPDPEAPLPLSARRPGAGRRDGARRSARPPRPPAGRTGPGGPGDGGPSLRARLSTIVIVAAIVGVFLMFAVGIELWTDALWYRSVGFDQVFWTRLGQQAGLFALGGLAALGLLLANLWLAGRLSPASPLDGAGGGTLRSWLDRLSEAQVGAERARTGGRPQYDQWDRTPREPISVTPIEFPDPVPFGRMVIVVVAVLAALGVAGSVAGSWETIALWQHRVPFDPSGAIVTDPVFGRDLSFFLFDLPFLRLIQTLINGLLVAALIVAGARYLLSAMAGAAVFDTRVRVHLGALAGLFLMSIALGYQLDKFELVHSNRGIATGVSFTDQNAQFLAYDVLTGLSAIAAAFLVGGAFARVLWPLTLTLAVWFIASIGIGRLYPAAIQQLTVVPNQYAQEQPYIANNIAMTRLAFDLNEWTERAYRGDVPLTEAGIAADAATFANARLWDYRPLGDTLDQLQTVRRYYDFIDVDTDRYMINGELRQVMLSGRELDLAKNPNATGWVNQRVIYTHGIGVAMVPVNEVASQGQPRLLISNLPPTSTGGAPTVAEPRIYFGEGNSSYVVVGARQPEFDYPRGNDTNDGDVVATVWQGKSGIPLDTTLNRLLFAIRFRDLNLLITDQVTNGSQLLFHRTQGERVRLIAPFLKFDKDPYIVIDGAGRLKYIQDAFTTSDQFPHGQAFDPDTELGPASGLRGDPFNYIRNSVKIVTDAYDGTMTYYVADGADPLIRAWQGVFPTLFRPLSELPADLVPHLRVPEELFDVQTRIYGRYHVTNPETFYSQNDLWTVPVGTGNDQTLPPEAYYVMMRMPGAEKAEFLLLQPMIPKDRPNMIAWVAARNGPDRYGQTTVFRFPSESTIFGPVQVEAQIDADPDISQQVSLWDQAGSEVVRGNLIVVPVGDSLIYLQPVYLRSKSSGFPAFERIVVASPTNVVWGTSLRDALTRLLAEQSGNAPGPSPSPGPTPSPGPGGSPGPTPTTSPGPTATPGATIPPSADVTQLVDYANAHFELAQEALRNGDFARYGAEIELVKQALAQLDALTNGSGSSAAPSIGPSSAP